MKTTPVTAEDFATSVIAVPPLARHGDFSLNENANRRLIEHLLAGGISTLMYGGNANFYNLPVSEYGNTLDMLARLVQQDTWIIPSVGPDYGRMLDHASYIQNSKFPTVMVLPLATPTTPDGVERGIRTFTDRVGRPVILYIKSEPYLTPTHVARLFHDGLVCGIKYAIVRAEPRIDHFLDELVNVVDKQIIISGIGERPALMHFQNFGLMSFTSGSVCVAPTASMTLLSCLKAGRYAEAEQIRDHFLSLEDLRDAISPIRVLHEAVTLAGVADMGPLLPLLSNLSDSQRPVVADASRQLIAYERTVANGVGFNSQPRAAAGSSMSSSRDGHRL